MRAAAILVLVACSSSKPTPDAETLEHLVAVRPMGGAWQVITPPCGAPIPVPAGPYELVAVAYSMTDPGHAYGSVLEAGSGDPSPVPACPGGVDYSQLTERTVTLIGASDAVFSGFTQTADVMAPSEVMLLAPGLSDVIAMTDDGSGLYFIERGASQTPDGLTLDFGTLGKPDDTRAVTLTGVPQGDPLQDFDVNVTTAGGVTLETSLVDSLLTPTKVATIPTTALMPGDTEHVMVVWADGTYAKLHWVDVDLVEQGSGALAIDMPPALDAVTVSSTTTTLDVSISASWTFNEVSTGTQWGLNGEGPEQIWNFAKLPGWPGTTLHVEGLTSIPGWDTAWTWEGGSWSGVACDVQGATTRCTSNPATDLP